LLLCLARAATPAPFALMFCFRCVFSLVLFIQAGCAQVLLGNEVLAATGFKELQDKRVGLLTNPSGVNRRLEPTVEVLRKAPAVKLIALFAPEHGVYGDLPAGKEFTNHVDKRTGLPVYSLYGPGPTRKPTAQMLKDLDALVYDLQDTGCRAYSYISTMGLAMEACGQAGVEFVVLDRPNPLGGERVEGPMLDPKFRSLVGQWEIPYVYGLTCGELARMIAGEQWLSSTCQVTVVPMQGWRRTMVWSDTGLPWVPTSPHVPNGDSPLFQVATGMLGEIGGLSIGIGYTLPFECLAAPWLDAQKTSRLLNGYNLKGVKFVPVTYTPFYGAFKGQTIAGAQIYFTEPANAPLTAVNFYALEAVKKLARRDLVSQALKAGRSLGTFDKVSGGSATRLALQAGNSAAAIVASWEDGEAAFRKQREKYLLYP
jgi:uncharacterized protein YbbC (DUF1343 family)